MASTRKKKPQKPLHLLALDGGRRAAVYAGHFEPAPLLELLDPRKVKRARKLWVELGTVGAAGQEAKLLGKLDRGKVIEVKLDGCAGCADASGGRKSERPRNPLSASQAKKLFSTVNARLKGLAFELAQPTVKRARKRPANGDIFIPIWPWPPIVIILEPATGCVAIHAGTAFCWWCPDTGGSCLL